MLFSFLNIFTLPDGHLRIRKSNTDTLISHYLLKNTPSLLHIHSSAQYFYSCLMYLAILLGADVLVKHNYATLNCMLQIIWHFWPVNVFFQHSIAMLKFVCGIISRLDLRRWPQGPVDIRFPVIYLNLQYLIRLQLGTNF